MTFFMALSSARGTANGTRAPWTAGTTFLTPEVSTTTGAAASARVVAASAWIWLSTAAASFSFFSFLSFLSFLESAMLSASERFFSFFSFLSGLSDAIAAVCRWSGCFLTASPRSRVLCGFLQENSGPWVRMDRLMDGRSLRDTPATTSNWKFFLLLLFLRGAIELCRPIRIPTGVGWVHARALQELSRVTCLTTRPEDQ